MNIFLAPDCDDEILFGSYIIQRTKPLVIVCLDGVIHEKKFKIPMEQRREESEQAAKIHGVEVRFLGIRDDKATVDSIYNELENRFQWDWEDWKLIFAPTKIGGNPNHDIVSDVGIKLGANLFYGTYTRDNFSPTGEMAIYPTEEEKKIKKQALACFKSQHGINMPHFEAVNPDKNIPEYLSFKL